MNSPSDFSARRMVLRSLGLLGSALALRSAGLASLLNVLDDVDESIIKERLRKYLSGAQSRNVPMSGLMMEMGKSFLGTPYAAHTLESDEEQLVVNLREVDCVTFVENTLALARCAKLGVDAPGDFRSQLQLIRYRNGAIDGYSSRLHYFSEWISDNDTKGIVRDVARELGGVRMEKAINFMSTHRSSYKQLTDDHVWKEIVVMEERLNATDRYYLPKEELAGTQTQFKDGDILAITTRIAGLDVSHTGLAIWQEESLKFLHAPITGEKVQISKRSLVDHLHANEKYTGLLIARPLEPVHE